MIFAAVPAGSTPACGLFSHCIELPFLFGTDADWANAPMLAGADPHEIDTLGRRLRTAWLGFIRAGAPTAGGRSEGRCPPRRRDSRRRGAVRRHPCRLPSLRGGSRRSLHCHPAAVDRDRAVRLPRRPHRPHRRVRQPKPVQQPHPPILVAGCSAAVLRAAAEHADLWNIPGGDTADAVQRSALLDLLNWTRLGRLPRAPRPDWRRWRCP